MEIFEVEVKGHTLKGVVYKIDAPKANLLIMTGMQEHATRYEHFAKHLNSLGLSVYVLDAVGQGLNAPKVEDQQKWYPGAFDINVTAANKKIMELKESTKLPTFLMGHSMGSFMSQRYLELFPNTADKVVLCSSNGPAKAKMTFGYLAAALLTNKKNWDKPSKFISDQSLGAYAKAIKDRDSDLDWLSYDEDNRKTYKDDPYCGVDNTHGFWKEFLWGMKELYKKKNLAKISKNEHILLVAGDGDPVGEMGKGVERLEKMYRNLGVEDVSMVIFPHMRHEILNETQKEKPYKVVSDFLLG